MCNQIQTNSSKQSRRKISMTDKSARIKGRWACSLGIQPGPSPPSGLILQPVPLICSREKWDTTYRFCLFVFYVFNINHFHPSLVKNTVLARSAGAMAICAPPVALSQARKFVGVGNVHGTRVNEWMIPVARELCQVDLDFVNTYE